MWRIPHGGANQAGVRERWLFETDIAALPELKMRLRDEFKGGLFRVRIYRNRKLRKGATWEIEAPPVAPADPKPQTHMIGADNQTAVLIAAALKPVADAMSMMAQQIQTLKQAPPAVDPFDMFERVTTIVTNLAPRQQESNMDKALDMLTKGIELGRTMEPGGGDDGIAGMVKAMFSSPLTRQLVEGAAAQMATARAQPQPAPPRAVAPPQSAPMPSPAAPPPVVDGEMNFSKLVDLLLRGAARGGDPSLYADLVFDQLQDREVSLLLSTPNVFEMAVAQYPQIGQYPDFFNGMLDALREIWVVTGAKSGAVDGRDNNASPAVAA